MQYQNAVELQSVLLRAEKSTWKLDCLPRRGPLLSSVLSIQGLKGSKTVKKTLFRDEKKNQVVWIPESAITRIAVFAGRRQFRQRYSWHWQHYDKVTTIPLLKSRPQPKCHGVSRSASYLQVPRPAHLPCVCGRSHFDIHYRRHYAWSQCQPSVMTSCY